MLETLIKAVTHPLLLTCIAALVITQGIKLLLYSLRDKKIPWHMVLSTGGMPSSHASIVTALTVGVLLFDGPTSLFVISLIFAGVVVRDALGVRWLAGEQSIAINKIIMSLREEGKINIKNVRELLGHTPLQVYVGCALGLLIALATYGVSMWT